MNFNRVITHDTTFHADDVFAVAMLQTAMDAYHGFPFDLFTGYYNVNENHFRGFELFRTRNPEILAAGLADPQILVLDVGGVYDPSMLNFDHHQDMNLMSAAGLVYEHFKDLICPRPDAQPFFEKFISAIDAMDTNRNNIYGVWATLPSGFRNVSSIIGGFNRDVTDPDQQFIQFRKAVEFAMVIIGNEVYNSERKAEFEAEYHRRVILPNNVAVFEEYSGIWKDKTDHVFAVMPHANGWQIQSRDTTIDVVPESIAHCPGFIFRHKSGFMAVVKDKRVAIWFAEALYPHLPE